MESSQQPYASEQLANVAAAVRQIRHPTQIGEYTILGLIGEGGMGSVYKAEQRTPIQRIVAIKIIKLGMDTREVIARFESERQALALMNHPNVAKVLEAGATETGRPYFVMEYVQGEPITAFADQRKLTVKERLELFDQACQAVQHAHQKAIIHRDLKPSNILVTVQDGRPWVKVIDFGVAKAMDARRTELTLFTETGQLVGTPEYMSPEQADPAVLQDIDTRSDVYSLGVVLYELLSGGLPFDPKSLRSAGYHEIQRIIRDVDPPRPSTRLSKLGDVAQQIAQCRQMPLESLSKQLKRELEWIPLKAMRKDRGQRYATATELSQDIHNYLESRPLRAGPESTAYRFRKFLRRNKRGVAASAAMLVLLIGGIAATAWQAVRATRAEASIRAEQARTLEQKRDAENAHRSARAVNDFLLNMLSQADPSHSRGQKVTVLEALDAAAVKIATSFVQQPLPEAAVRIALAETYTELSRPDLALPHAKAAVDLRSRELGSDHPQTLQAKEILGYVLKKQGKFGEAEVLDREAAAGLRRQLGDDHPEALTAVSDLAVLLQSMGKYPEAETLHRDVLTRRRRVLGNTDKATLQSLNNLGSILSQQNKNDEAEALYREGLKGLETGLGHDHPDTLKIMHNLATLLLDEGKFDQAEPLFREVLDVSRRVLGEDHVDTLVSVEALADLLRTQGKLAEAEPLYRQVVARAKRALGEDHPATLAYTCNLSLLLQEMGKSSEAEPLYRDVIERQRRLLGPEHPSTLTTMGNLALSLQSRGQNAEAEELYRFVLEGRRRALGPDHPDTLGTLQGMNMILRDQGKYAEAEPLCRELVEKCKKVIGPEHPNTLKSMNMLATVLQSEGKLAEAEQVFRDVLEARRRILGEEHPGTLSSLHNLALVFLAKSEPANAEPILRDATTRMRKVLGPEHPQTLSTSYTFAAALEKLDRWDEALPITKELFEQVHEPGRVATDTKRRNLYLVSYGVCLAHLQRYAEALEPLTFAHQALVDAGDNGSAAMRDVLDKLAVTSDALNQPADATKWRNELAALPTTAPSTSQPATAPASSSKPAGGQ